MEKSQMEKEDRIVQDGDERVDWSKYLGPIDENSPGAQLANHIYDVIEKQEEYWKWAYGEGNGCRPPLTYENPIPTDTIPTKWNGTKRFRFHRTKEIHAEMVKKYGSSGYSWSGEWDNQEDLGIRDPQDIDDDDVHSLFQVYALGDLGCREHNLSIEKGGMLTNLERIIFESCWPGAKVSRHEVNVSDGTTNSFKAEILSKRLKCNVSTAQKLVEVFRGLQLRPKDVEKLLREGMDGMDFYNPEHLPVLYTKLVNLDMELPELPPNPTVEYTDEGWVKYRLGYNRMGQLVPETEEEEDDWPDPTEDDLLPGGTPDAFRSIPIGWNARKMIIMETEEINVNFGDIMESLMMKEIYEDPRERDFLDDWFPKQPMNYKRLYQDIGDCIKHKDLELIGKAMHSDPEMEKLDRIQQSMLWTKYKVHKDKLEHRTKVYLDKLIGFIRKYPVNKALNVRGKKQFMGQVLFDYQKNGKLNLSSRQWNTVWKAYKAKKGNSSQFRPSCSELNI